MITFADLVYLVGQALAWGFIVRQLWRGDQITISEYTLLVACALLMSAPLIGPVFEE